MLEPVSSLSALASAVQLAPGFSRAARIALALASAAAHCAAVALVWSLAPGCGWTRMWRTRTVGSGIWGSDWIWICATSRCGMYLESTLSPKWVWNASFNSSSRMYER